jgi:hypothetical protein
MIAQILLERLNYKIPGVSEFNHLFDLSLVHLPVEIRKALIGQTWIGYLFQT